MENCAALRAEDEARRRRTAHGRVAPGTGTREEVAAGMRQYYSGRSAALFRSRKQSVVRRPPEPLHPLAVGEHHRDAPRLTRFDESAHAVDGIDVVFPIDPM